MQLKDIKGVGSKTLLKLEKLGIKSIDDLVRFLPKKYWDMTKEADLDQAEHGDYVLIKGKVSKKYKVARIRRGFTLFKCNILSNDKKVTVVWYNLPYVGSQIEEDKEYIFWGKLSKKDGLSLSNPNFESVDSNKRLQGIVPIYPTKGEIGQQQIRNYIQEAFYCDFNSPVDVYCDLSLKEALYKVHFPLDMEDMRIGKNRYNLEDLIIQYIAYRINKDVDSDNKIRKYGQNMSVIADDVRSLPYELTDSQKKAVREILLDLKGEKRTNRMLLGDVGSGKTVVALLASMYVIKNGYQVAIMVPTEILAKQHFKTATSLFGQKINIALLTSSTIASDRKKILQDLKDGKINLIIGTHSVLNDKVEFKNLSFIIIDELHRFGVKQKGTLEEKTKACDVLSMSATPIPRAIALTIYGDLSISTLKQRQGASNVSTFIMGDEKLEGLYGFIKERVQCGEQAYIVCPLVVDSEGIEVFSAKELYKEVIKKELSDINVGLIYGSMKDKDKNAVMQAFYNKELDVLIATSVIEVGIDSQYASIMAVLNADRFGLATLHQLRGRVGRKSGLKSYCFLHTSKSQENERLKALKDNKDGDAIAEFDASIRGYGDFLGTRQSGGSFKGDAIITKKVIEQSKEIADKLLASKDFDLSMLVNIDEYLEKLQQISLN